MVPTNCKEATMLGDEVVVGWRMVAGIPDVPPESNIPIVPYVPIYPAIVKVATPEDQRLCTTTCNVGFSFEK